MYSRIYGYTMSIPLLIYSVLAKMMSAVDSASLGNGIFDPLVPSVEASGGLSNEMALSILRKNISPEELINKDGYIFNPNRCIQFNNRILCGYDKNRGTLLDDYTMLDVGNGCRSRGDRIECGYDNPRFYKSLRWPSVEHGEHKEHDKHSEHDALHENNHHARNHHQGGKPHHHGGNHHHQDKHQESLARQAPTRTAMITDPTTESIVLNRIKTDYLANKLLKTALDKVVMKTEDTSIGSLKTTTDYIKPIKSSTDTEKPLTTTTTKPTMRKSTIISKRQKFKSTTSKATATASTTEITTTPTSSELNDISDGETIKRIVKLAPVRKPKRRRLTETLSKFPKLVRKSISDGTAVPPIATNCETTSNGAVFREKTGSEQTVTTACVEQDDRVVCYDLKT